MDYTELVRERILLPLGMTMTGHRLEGEISAWMTQGHRNGRVVPSQIGPVYGSGGLRSNMEDMLEYLRANLGPPETDLERAMQAAHEPRRPWGRGSSRIGLAWNNTSTRGRRIIEHGGNTNGFSSFIAFDPEERVGVVMLSNADRYSDNTHVELLVHGPTPAISEARVPADVLGRLVGEYELASEGSVHVRMEEEGFLTFQEPGRARARLYAESDTSFFLKQRPVIITFPSEGGEVLRLVEGREAVQQTARKVADKSPPPAVVAGNAVEWLGKGWLIGIWGLAGSLGLVAMLTLGAELKRAIRSKR
jgi:hypothetical protein